MLKWEDVPSDLQELIMTSTQRGVDKKQQGVDFGVSIADDVMLEILRNLCLKGVDTSVGCRVDVGYQTRCYFELHHKEYNVDEYISTYDIADGVVEVFKTQYGVKGFGEYIADDETLNFVVDDVVSVIKGVSNKSHKKVKQWWRWW